MTLILDNQDSGGPYRRLRAAGFTLVLRAFANSIRASLSGHCYVGILNLKQ